MSQPVMTDQNGALQDLIDILEDIVRRASSRDEHIRAMRALEAAVRLRDG
jgi:hypothetical protein